MSYQPLLVQEVRYKVWAMACLPPSANTDGGKVGALVSEKPLRHL